MFPGYKALPQKKGCPQNGKKERKVSGRAEKSGLLCRMDGERVKSSASPIREWELGIGTVGLFEFEWKSSNHKKRFPCLSG